MYIRSYLLQLFILIVVGFLLVELWIYLSVAKNDADKPMKRSVLDYEALLCNDDPKPDGLWLENSSVPCPTQGIITAFHHWGLCISLWQYANMIAASMNTGMNPYLPVCMKHTLERVFSKLPLPILSDIGHCFIPLRESAKTLQSWTKPTQSIVIKTTDLYNDVVMEHLEVVREHLKLNKVLIDFAASFLLSVKQKRTQVTYIGVYITRTSIIVNQEYDNIFPSPQFYIDAMNHFRVRYQDALFVTITDRKGFWEHFFRKQDVVVVNEQTLKPFGSALAVLSLCNHTILSTDDFAVWGAILSGGEAVVSASLSENYYALMQKSVNWTYLLKNPKSVNKILEKI